MQNTHTHTQITADYVVAEVREIVVTFKWSLVETEPSCGTELALMYSSIVAGAFETIRMYQKCTHSSSSLCDWPRKHTVNPVDMDYFPQSNNRSSKSRPKGRFLQCVWKKAAKKKFKRCFQVKELNPTGYYIMHLANIPGIWLAIFITCCPRWLNFNYPAISSGFRDST